MWKVVRSIFHAKNHGNHAKSLGVEFVHFFGYFWPDLTVLSEDAKVIGFQWPVGVTKEARRSCFLEGKL